MYSQTAMARQLHTKCLLAWFSTFDLVGLIDLVPCIAKMRKQLRSGEVQRGILLEIVAIRCLVGL